MKFEYDCVNLPDIIEYNHRDLDIRINRTDFNSGMLRILASPKQIIGVNHFLGYTIADIAKKTFDMNTDTTTLNKERFELTENSIAPEFVKKINEEEYIQVFMPKIVPTPSKLGMPEIFPAQIQIRSKDRGNIEIVVVDNIHMLDNMRLGVLHREPFINPSYMNLKTYATLANLYSIRNLNPDITLRIEKKIMDDEHERTQLRKSFGNSIFEPYEYSSTEKEMLMAYNPKITTAQALQVGKNITKH